VQEQAQGPGRKMRAALWSTDAQMEKELALEHAQVPQLQEESLWCTRRLEDITGTDDIQQMINI
jgi:hypothetical protein